MKAGQLIVCLNESEPLFKDPPTTNKRGNVGLWDDAGEAHIIRYVKKEEVGVLLRIEHNEIWSVAGARQEIHNALCMLINGSLGWTWSRSWTSM